jgi:hypothetical protein
MNAGSSATRQRYDAIGRADQQNVRRPARKEPDGHHACDLVDLGLECDRIDDREPTDIEV